MRDIEEFIERKTREDIKSSSAFLSKLHGSADAVSNPDKVVLAPPVFYAAAKVASFFGRDRDMCPVLDYQNSVLRIFIKDEKNADAVNYFIKNKIELGDQSLSVRVVKLSGGLSAEELPPVSEKKSVEEELGLLKSMLPHARFTDVFDPVCQVTYHFVELPAVVCSYRVDCLRNPHGFESAMLEDVFKYAFDVNPHIYVSTNPSEY